MRLLASILFISLILITGCQSRPAFDWNKPRYVLYLSPHQMVLKSSATPIMMPDAKASTQQASASHGIPQPRYLPGVPNRAEAADTTPPQDAAEAVDAIIAAEQKKADADDGRFSMNAVETYEYEPNKVYSVVTSPGFVTTIELQAGETYLNIAGGDSANWVIDTIDGGTAGQQTRTYVLIKPRRPFQKTNLIITTDRRAYHLELASLEEAAYHTAITWTYAQVNNIVIRRASEEEVSAILERARRRANPPTVNYGYNVLVRFGEAHPVWTPTRVYDDGRQVVIEFPEESRHFSRPVLFVKRADGTDSLINYRMAGDRCVTHTLFDEAELRLGTQVVRIKRAFSKHYAPAPPETPTSF